MSYSDLIRRKLSIVPPTGLRTIPPMPDGLLPLQSALVPWALRRGRAAIFADTGLGKSRMEVSYAHAILETVGCYVLILAPLAVAEQTVGEGEAIGITVVHARDEADIPDSPCIVITNYERLHRFNTKRFGAVVLDESSCIKHHDAKTLRVLMDAFSDTPYKLCATATPAPNDWTELGTHAEFLGICTRSEMLSEYFMHDGGETQTWRLKGHAREQFWRWVASWAALVRRPSDLGFDDSLYILPPLHVHQHQVTTEARPTDGMLFALEANTLSERRDARRASLEGRTAECARLIKDEWYKLAALSQERNSDELEAGVSSEQGCAGGDRSFVKSEAIEVRQGQPREEQGSPEEVHGGVLQAEHAEVQALTGAASEVQRGAPEEVRGMRGHERESQLGGKGVLESESGQAEGRKAPSQLRNLAGAISFDACGSARQVRDLRTLGHDEQECVSACGSLPLDGEDSRHSVHELQSRAREVQGQAGTIESGGSVSLEPWLIWVDLNAEQDLLEKHFGDTAFSVRGNMSAEDKEAAIKAWMAGERPVMISKPSIMGWGINAQHCARMAFVGVTDSFEAYYQAVRRCYRFGQKRAVHVHIFASELEGAIVANLRRKECDASVMAEALARETGDAVRTEVLGLTRETNPYQPRIGIKAPSWLKTEAA